jgi:hypothetical protein
LVGKEKRPVNLETQAGVKENQAGDAKKAFIVLAAALLATSVYFFFLCRFI